MSTAKLEATVSQLLTRSLAPSSRETYIRGWRRFKQFTHEYQMQIKLPIPYSQMALFIAYMYNNKSAPSTIITYCSAISYVHKLQSFPDPMESFCIKKLLTSVQKGSQTDTRLPITVDVLIKLVHAVNYICHSHYEKVLIKAMFLLAFHAMLRIGEMTQSYDKEGHALQVADVSFEKTPSILGVSLTFRHFKHYNGKDPIVIYIKTQGKNSIMCPVTALYDFMVVRGNKAGPLFTYPDAKGICRSYFTQKLQSALAHSNLPCGRFRGHSFRIGGATAAAQAGVPDAQIRRMGRWQSDAYMRYIRTRIDIN